MHIFVYSTYITTSHLMSHDYDVMILLPCLGSGNKGFSDYNDTEMYKIQ